MLQTQYSVDKTQQAIFQNQLESVVDHRQQIKVVSEVLNNNWCQICYQAMNTIEKLNMCLLEVSVTQQEAEKSTTVIKIQDLAILLTNQFASLRRLMYVNLKLQTKWDKLLKEELALKKVQLKEDFNLMMIEVLHLLQKIENQGD